MENNKIKVHTADQRIFEMEKSDALEILLIRTKIEEEDGKDEIELENIGYNELEKITEFLHQLQIKPYKAPLPKPLPSSHLEEVIENKWFINFIDLPKKELLKLIKAANYLNVERLFDLASAKIASEIQGMSIEELREFFEIKNDFSKDEEESIINGKANIYKQEEDELKEE